MPFEESTTSSSEQEAKKTSTPDEAQNQEKFTGQTEASEHTASVLNPENKSFLRKMSEGGAKIANQVYEGLYKIPGVNRIVGKLEIAYNQFWINLHQKKAVQFKEKMDSLDLRISALDQSRKEIESAIESLKSQNIPGVESLQIKLQDIDRQKVGLLNEKDRAQSKFEARENKLKLYTNERDRVANKLIEHYEEKLRPMEEELERLQTFNDQIDLLVVVTEAKHKEQLAKLGDIEKKKTQIEEALRRTGMSEKEIRKLEAIKQLDKALADGREKIRIERENLARRKAEINKRIAKVDAKANHYRDKREEFVRVKEGRPIKIEVAKRQRGAEFRGEEEIRAHTRSEATHRESKTETESAEDKERLQTAAYIDGWNAFLKETYKEKAELIDPEDFLRATGLSENFRLGFEDFKNILRKYLKFRKLPMEQFNKSIDAFFEKKVKVEK
jgi:hypothetical protein